MTTKNKKIEIRVTEEDLNKIKLKSQKAKMTISEYVRKSTLEKENIIIIDNLSEMIKELNGVAKNLNQQTILAHKGTINKIQLKDIENVIAELNNLWTKIYEMR